MSIGEKFGSLFNSLKENFIKNRLLIAVALVIFLSIGIVFYYKYIRPKLNKAYVDNREFISKDSDILNKTNSAELFFFYTDWCPLSKKAEPEWNAFKESTNGSFNGVSISFREIDCDKETDIADKFNINGYPTIKLIYNDKIYEYDAKPDQQMLNTFLTDIFKNP